jgi:hypothetical protein
MAIIAHSLPESSPRLWSSRRAWVGSFGVAQSVRQKRTNVGDNNSANF